jgi:RHH-type proline utilization regulon transcriptional repressor/proline dehydrogenase/delta 1-pyrroline-5-carboxylate dehydrogenase
MLFDTDNPAPVLTRPAVNADFLADETRIVQQLLTEAETSPATQQAIDARARELVEAVRSYQPRGLDALLQEYDLSSQEGVVLMCLAEALLRIPDSETADKLIRDKLRDGQWESHLGKSSSLLVNASTWGLMLTGRLVGLDAETKDVGGVLNRLIARVGEPVVRLAMNEAMRILGQQFVMGRTIEEAFQRSQAGDQIVYRYSFDMLGEAARTQEDADRYFNAYQEAIDILAEHGDPDAIESAPGISVKLSALHPRFEYAQHGRVMRELVPRLLQLAIRARQAGIGLAVDAEEADRLDLTVDVFAAVFCDPALANWEGLGVVVQTYLKRARALVDWLADLATSQSRRIMVRLVKGAYWDSEIKHAQQLGLKHYPVFTRKHHTDVCYLACTKAVLARPDAFYPQFATHNARTVAAVMELAGESRDYEFQRLHGMGEALFGHVLAEEQPAPPCRVYAPVGQHEDLLPYLVRRLLENGSNTSFVNRITDLSVSADDIIADPVTKTRHYHASMHPRIPLPTQVYGDERQNASGLNLVDPQELTTLDQAMSAAAQQHWHAEPMGKNAETTGREQSVINPANHDDVVGTVVAAHPHGVTTAIACAADAAADWAATPAEERARALEKAADAIEAEHAALMALVVREGGRCVTDALSEVREAVDFCRYHAARARGEFSTAVSLTGPTGETNQLALHPRGVFACISPWNFPLAIFTGQITAALAAGNPVVAKPATATPLTAAHVVRLLYAAGIPDTVLHLLPGSGAELSPYLLDDANTHGVAFTGSTDTARQINQHLANRSGPIAPFIAETGGQNAMIVDSSALVEQVVLDVMQSAFNSAGQRCSALRVLFLQNDIAPRVLKMLTGAMEQLQIGDPALIATDVGPVISATAQRDLLSHVARLQKTAKPVFEMNLPAADVAGHFVAPVVYEIDDMNYLQHEVFGPILHVIRFDAKHLDRVIDAINATGYGLTLGIHSRIESTQRHITSRVRVGNMYINRNMIGAVVGVQPFGGEGLSGTGPKAGGPHYLHRFATERVITTNTTAVGGNASLLALQDD